MFHEKRRRTETAVVKKKKNFFEGFMLVVGVSFSFFNWVDRLSFRLLLTKTVS